jgi:hydrogenase maturation protease
MPHPVVVIGVGNGIRGDDAAGLEVVRRLADLNGKRGIDVLAHEGDGMTLLELWEGADAVVLVDSVRSGAVPGTIVRIDAGVAPLPAQLHGTSSHATSVAQAIELARTLGRLPATVVVYGIEGTAYEPGSALSEPVLAAVAPAAEAVRDEALALSLTTDVSGQTLRRDPLRA